MFSFSWGCGGSPPGIGEAPASPCPWLRPSGPGNAGCGAGLARRLPESPGVRQPESGREGSPCGRGFHSVMESRGKRKCAPCPFDTLTPGEPGPRAPSLQLQMPQALGARGQPPQPPEDTARAPADTWPQGGSMGRTLGSVPSHLTSPLCQVCPGARAGSESSSPCPRHVVPFNGRNSEHLLGARFSEPELRQ